MLVRMFSTQLAQYIKHQVVNLYWSINAAETIFSVMDQPSWKEGENPYPGKRTCDTYHPHLAKLDGHVIRLVVI